MKISKEKAKEYLKLLFIFLLIFLIYIPMGCPIKLFTGVSCAGCGMTRAYFSLLHFNFSEAFHYHPLFICPIIFVAVYIMTKLGFPKKAAKVIYSIMAFLFIAVYIFRMINPDDRVVVFEPQNGLIFKAIQYIISLIRQ